MLARARAACAASPAVTVVGGDAERLPLATGSVQLVLANLVLPWCRPQNLFVEAARVLEAGGLLLFATLGPDSLQEVRRAWAAVDDRLHVHAAFDMHDLGDLALAAGLAEPVLDVDRLELTYERPAALVRDLRAWGAVNVAAGRRRELTGPKRWRAFDDAAVRGPWRALRGDRRARARTGVGRGPAARRRAGPHRDGLRGRANRTAAGFRVAPAEKQRTVVPSERSAVLLEFAPHAQDACSASFKLCRTHD